MESFAFKTVRSFLCTGKHRKSVPSWVVQLMYKVEKWPEVKQQCCASELVIWSLCWSVKSIYRVVGVVMLPVAVGGWSTDVWIQSVAMTMDSLRSPGPTDVILTFYSVSCYQCRSIDILKERGLLTSENPFKRPQYFWWHPRSREL